MIRTAALLTVLVGGPAGGLAGGLAAQQLNLLLPAGATRGTEVTVRCYGRGLQDTASVVWLRDGIETVAIKAERDDRVQLTLKVPADCELGTYLFLLHTRRGLTRAKAFRVGALPSVTEAKEHATREQAQQLDLDVTVDGRILAEQIDWYAFDAAAGQIIRAEAEGVRLGLYDLDLQLEIFDPDGVMLVRSDDTALGKADPIATFTAAKAGTYTLSLRDVAWRGSTYGAYRLHVGTFARPAGLVPAGGRPGETVAVTLAGDAEPATAQLELPDRPGLHEVFPVVNGKPIPTPVLVAVDDRPSFVEDNRPPEPPTAPCAFHGIIAREREEDRFEFRAGKGQRIELRVLARNLRSPLDPVLIVRDAKGKELSSNDDGLGLDGRLTFTAPADGTFLACVRDHLLRGSDASFYRLEVGAIATPGRTQEAVPGRRSEDFGVSVPAGRRNATVIQATAINLRDGVTLDFGPLPPGVTATPMRVPEGTTLVPIVFTAAADAAIATRLAVPTATAAKGAPDRPIEHAHGIPTLRVRNNQAYDTRAVRALPVAVTQTTPFDVAADAPRVPIVRSGSLELPVRVVRDKDFTAAITIRALWLPPGLSAGTVSIGGENTTGAMAFNANASAALGTWPIVLVASASIGGVTQTVSTEAMMFELQEPWITARLPRARIEQGGKGTFEVEIDRRRAFEGKVTATLGRMPKGVAIEIPEIGTPESGTPESGTPESGTNVEKLQIALQAGNDAPVGRHRSIYMRILIETADGVISHAVGNGELRVDRPLPPELRAPASKPGGTQ